MKLYYSPGACSQASHIALHESGLPFTSVLASTKTHQLADGSDYYRINPLGYVPLLELPDGSTLTEGPAIMQYIADQAAPGLLAPAPGSMPRYRLQSWLNFIATELHKGGFSPLFNAAAPAAFKEVVAQRLLARLAWVDQQLADRDHLLGAQFSVADAYLFVVASWAPRVQLDISALSRLQALCQRVAARPAVQATLRAEGLLA